MTAAPARAGIGATQRAQTPLMGYQNMRRRLFGILGTLVVVGLLATPVASAASGQSSWEPVTGRAFDQCTGEYFDNSGKVHFVETDTGRFHFNNHLEGIGESTGTRYVINTEDNEFSHVAADGSSTIDQVLNLHVVSKGNLPDSWLTIRVHLVVASDGSVSGTNDFSFGCHGS
jgi:hypothetical protein